MTKIVLVSHRFLPRFIGGVELYTLRLAGALQQLGHQVHILTGEPKPGLGSNIFVSEDEVQSLPITRINYDFDYYPVSDRASYHQPRVTGEIKAALNRLQPDLVHAISLSLFMGGTIEAATHLDIPLIYTATDFVLTCRRGTYFKRDNTICTAREELALCTACLGPYTKAEQLLNRLWRVTPASIGRPMLPLVENLMGKKAEFVYAASSIAHRLNTLPQWRQKITHIIAPTTYMRDVFVLNDFPVERITISPFGVRIPETIPEKIPAAKKLRFGFFGRITPIKGVHVLLEAFAMLGQFEAAQLTIYGGADTKSKLYAQAIKEKAARLPNVRLAGAIDPVAIPDLYREIDILVIPSIWLENSPITLLDALAYQVPVIISDVGGMTDFIKHEQNGLIFANQDAQDLAIQLKRCLASSELVTHLTRQTRPVKSMEEDAAGLVKLYREILP